MSWAINSISFGDITNYNNYYEFSEDKQAPAAMSQNFKPSPWSVQVGGLVQNPKTYTIEDLLKFQQKERIYRLRCVEAWSMVIPWTGFELSDLLNEVQPMTSAKYVAFTTLMDPKQMPMRLVRFTRGLIPKGCVWMRPCSG